METIIFRGYVSFREFNYHRNCDIHIFETEGLLKLKVGASQYFFSWETYGSRLWEMGGPRHLGVLFRANSPYRHPTTEIEVVCLDVHPGRLTWNIQITHLERKMIFQTSMIMFHVNLQGCIYRAGIIKWDPFGGDQTMQMYAKYEGIPP